MAIKHSRLKGKCELGRGDLINLLPEVDEQDYPSDVYAHVIYEGAAIAFSHKKPQASLVQGCHGFVFTQCKSTGSILPEFGGPFCGIPQ